MDAFDLLKEEAPQSLHSYEVLPQKGGEYEMNLVTTLGSYQYSDAGMNGGTALASKPEVIHDGVSYGTN